MRAPHLGLPAPADGMNLAKRPTGIVMSLVVLLIALAVMSIPTAVQMVASGSLQSAGLDMPFSRAGGLLSLFSFPLAVGFLWLWLATKERRRFASLGFEAPRSGLRFALRGAGIGFGMMLFCVLVPVLTGQATLSWSGLDATGALFVLAMLLGFLVQGSTEEILTRGYLTQAVARRWGLIAAVIVQAVFFALLHGANPGVGLLPIVNLLLFAGFASALSLAEGGLWGVCAMHGVWNWAQGNVFGVAVSGNPVEDTLLRYTPDSTGGAADLLTGGAFGIEGSLTTSVVYLVGTVIAWRAFRRRSRTDGTHPGNGAAEPTTSAEAATRP